MTASTGHAPAIVSAVLASDRPEQLSGGRTNAVWRAGGQVAKLYDHAAATPLFRNDPAAELAVLSALDGQRLAPRPVALHPDAGGDVLVYEHLEAVDGPADPRDVAALLGRVHGSGPVDGLPFGAQGADILIAGDRMIGPDDPLHAWRPAPPPQVTPVLIHTDPVATNLVMTADGLRLIDWQCPENGDPAIDLAHALSPAMQLLYGPTGDAMAFLGGYPDAAVVQRYRAFGRAYHWRMACYCQWQVLRGNAAYGPARDAEAGLIRNWPF